MTDYKKSQPVVVLGAVIAALTFIIDSLQALFKDNPTIVLILSVVGIVVAGLAIFKDQFLKMRVVPVEDTATYIDQKGQLVAGPASPLPDGTPVFDKGGVLPIGVNVVTNAGDSAIPVTPGDPETA